MEATFLDHDNGELKQQQGWWQQELLLAKQQLCMNFFLQNSWTATPLFLPDDNPPLISLWLDLSCDYFSVELPSSFGTSWSRKISYQVCLNQPETEKYLKGYNNSLQTADISPRLSLLRDVSQGGTSVTQRQKFHTDDAKSVRNPIRRANWSTE